MSLANSMFVFLILLNFGGGLCKNEWPEWINCSAEIQEKTYDWAMRNELPPNVFVTRDLPLGRNNFDASSHQNFSRSPNCDESSSINLCHEKDSEECVLGTTGLCVRSDTLLDLVHNSTALFAMHDYNCDGVGNQFYYALGLFRVEEGADTINLPQNLKTEINLISTSDMLYARLYLFRFLPEKLGGPDKYFAAGFVYLKVALPSILTGVNVGGLPGNKWPKWVECSAKIQEETYDWAITQIQIPDHLIVQRNLSDLAGTSSHQNFTRDEKEVCGSSVNLCNPDEDLEICVFDTTSVCVRSTASQHLLFEDSVSIFATHDFHCDDQGNQLYYAFALFKVAKINTDELQLPKNIESEINLASIFPNVRTTYARFYLFHLLPTLFQDDYYTYYARGFVYFQGSIVTAVTSVVSNL